MKFFSSLVQYIGINRITNRGTDTLGQRANSTIFTSRFHIEDADGGDADGSSSRCSSSIMRSDEHTEICTVVSYGDHTNSPPHTINTLNGCKLKFPTHPVVILFPHHHTH